MIFVIFQKNLKEMVIMAIKQDSDLSEQIDVESILNDTELVAARQAFNIVQGALSSVPVMGLDMYESALTQARARFTLVGNPVLRKLVVQCFNITLAGFLQGLSQMSCPELSEVKIEKKETPEKNPDPAPKTTPQDDPEVGDGDREEDPVVDLEEDETLEDDDEEDEEEEI
jgi:hypothetical protein